ncbi:phospholipase D-like domain-containing protein [Actinomadura coerulea]|uniref:phospholipase D-like domain-containing protein n=1 Tax=Actinomadura coerulea TaxID=46159 RepID=UPI0034321B48
MRSRGFTLAAAALLAGAGLAAPASASAAAPAEAGKAAPGLTNTATFNEPPGGKIVLHLVDMIENAEPGSTILFTAFRFEEAAVANALVDASRSRGVKVKLLVDGGATEADSQVFERVKQAFEEDGNSETWAKECWRPPHPAMPNGPPYHSCQGTGAMHNKFVLFTKTKGASYVVSTGSANLRKSSGTNAWNSWYTHVGNADLYKRYADYFTAMAGMRERLDYYNEDPPKLTGNIKSYFYPRAPVEGDAYANDTVAHTLEATGCPGKIRIANWSLTRSTTAKWLVKKAASGCTVEIIVSKMHGAACLPLVQAAELGYPVRMWSYEQGAPNYVHTKDMMIEAPYPNTTQQAKVVFTGSANFNRPSLEQNDENVLRIMNDDLVYGAFVENFNNIKNHVETSGQGFQIKNVQDCERAYPQG